MVVSKSAILTNVLPEEVAQNFAQAIVKVITDKKIDTSVGSSLALKLIAHEISDAILTTSS